MSSLSTRLRVRKTLRLNIFDGASVFAMAGLTQNYITPFALALKATTAQIGLLNSFPGFASALSQLGTPVLVKRAGSRKAVIMWVVFAQALMWIPVFLVPYLLGESGVWWLIALFTIAGMFGALSNAPWSSMMADLVHEDVRGRYFSFRGRINTFTFLAFSLIAGFLLQSLAHNVFLGFALLFGGSMFFRLLSFNFLARMYEPPMVVERQRTPSPVEMGKKFLGSNLGKFTLFIALMYFSIMLAGAFFSVYMLRDLKLSYLTFTLINCSSTVSTIVCLRFWGRRADRAGNLKILRITGCLLPVVPVLWLLNTNPIYLACANAFSGFVWAGFDLSTGNFLFDASEAETRTRQIALFNCVINVAVGLGSLTGGFIAPHLPSLLGYQLRTLFTLSGVLRAVVVVLVLSAITEVRHVPRIGILSLLMGRTRHSRGNKKGMNPAH